MAFQANKSMTSSRAKGVRPLVAIAAGSLLAATVGLVLVALPSRRIARARLPTAAQEHLVGIAVQNPTAAPPAPARFVPPPSPAPASAVALVAAQPARPTPAPPPPAQGTPALPALAPPPPTPARDPLAPTAAELAAASLKIDPGGEYPVKGLPATNPILAFDPNLWTALRKQQNRIPYLTYAEPVRACAKAFVLRQGYQTWSLGGIANVRMTVANRVVRFDAVNIIDWPPSGNPDRPPDQEFLDCFGVATKRLRIACRDCKDGSVELKMKLIARTYDAQGELDNTVDPAIADSDFSVVAP
jgi:hypothetical protein